MVVEVIFIEDRTTKKRVFTCTSATTQILPDKSGNVVFLGGRDENSREVLTFTAAHCESITKYA